MQEPKPLLQALSTFFFQQINNSQATNTLKGTKRNQGQHPFQRLHLTHGIHVLVYFPNFFIFIPSLQLCARFFFKLLHIDLYDLYYTCLF